MYIWKVKSRYRSFAPVVRHIDDFNNYVLRVITYKRNFSYSVEVTLHLDKKIWSTYTPQRIINHNHKIVLAMDNYLHGIIYKRGSCTNGTSWLCTAKRLMMPRQVRSRLHSAQFNFIWIRDREILIFYSA